MMAGGIDDSDNDLGQSLGFYDSIISGLSSLVPNFSLSNLAAPFNPGFTINTPTFSGLDALDDFTLPDFSTLGLSNKPFEPGIVRNDFNSGLPENFDITNFDLTDFLSENGLGSRGTEVGIPRFDFASGIPENFDITQFNLGDLTLGSRGTDPGISDFFRNAESPSVPGNQTLSNAASGAGAALGAVGAGGAGAGRSSSTQNTPLGGSPTTGGGGSGTGLGNTLSGLLNSPLAKGALGGAAGLALIELLKSLLDKDNQQAPAYVSLGAAGPAPAAAAPTFVQRPSHAQSYQSMLGLKDGGVVAKYDQLRQNNPVVLGALDYLPVSGQVLSVGDAISAADKGNYGDAAANLMGLIPLLKARKMASAGREALEQAAKAGRYIDAINDTDQNAERAAKKYGTVKKANGGPVHMQTGDFVFSKKALDKAGGIDGLRKRGYPAQKITGPGTGTSDSIPATIDGVEPARVANGEALIRGGAQMKGLAALHKQMRRA